MHGSKNLERIHMHGCMRRKTLVTGRKMRALFFISYLLLTESSLFIRANDVDYQNGGESTDIDSTEFIFSDETVNTKLSQYTLDFEQEAPEAVHESEGGQDAIFVGSYSDQVKHLESGGQFGDTEETSENNNIYLGELYKKDQDRGLAADRRAFDQVELQDELPNKIETDYERESCRNTKAKCPHDPNFCHCYLCPHWRYVNGTRQDFIRTVCYSVRSSTNVSKILSHVNSNTTDLEIVVDNTWGGYYPLKSLPIDLRNISRLTNLETFMLTMGYYNFLQPYPLIYGNSFQNLTKLKQLRINLPLMNQPLVDMIAPLKNLEVLNISFTRGLSMKSVSDILKKVSNSSLRGLHLQTFQLIGGSGYRGVLNMTTFLSKRIFEKLEEITLSENSLYRLYPGIIRAAPNLKLFDISGNILLDSVNIPAFLEAALHPTIEFLDMGYQGFIGGGDHKYRNHGKTQQNLYNHSSEKDHNKHHALLQTSEQSADNFWMNSLGGLNRHKRSGNPAPVHKGVVSKYINKMIIHCMNLNDNQNVSNLLQEKSMFYKTLQCVLPRQFGQSSVFSNDILDVLPHITDMLNTSCMLFMNLPVGKQLKKIYFNQIHWEESVTLGVLLKGNLCFMPNQVNTILFTHNEGWLASAKLADVLNSITNINGAENLEHLDLSNNNMTFNITGITGYFPNLTYINVAGNNISMPDKFTICDKLTELETIDMRSNKFNLNGSYFKISRDIAANCPKLKYLYLSDNNMTTGLKLNFSGTYQLELLDLSHNRLHFLDETLQQNLSAVARKSRRVIEVYLTGNELLCGCTEKALQFYRWMVTERGHINITNADNMMCVSSDNYLNLGKISLKQIDEMYEKCFPSSVPIILGAVLGSISFICLVFGSFATYKNRWRLWYRWFCFKSMMKRKVSPEDKSNMKWKYDAFVSYCGEDRFWVHDVLMKTLEEHYGFRLCIHYRDFPVGESIPITVSRSMSDSREVIVVISQIALKSDWCCFELDQAVLQAQRRKKALIVIKMGKFKNPLDNSTAAHVLDRYTYLEWPEKKEGHKLFWAKLVAKMYGDDDGCACCLLYGAKAIKYNEIQDENTYGERTPLLNVATET